MFHQVLGLDCPGHTNRSRSGLSTRSPPPLLQNLFGDHTLDDSTCFSLLQSLSEAKARNTILSAMSFEIIFYFPGYLSPPLQAGSVHGIIFPEKHVPIFAQEGSRNLLRPFRPIIHTSLTKRPGTILILSTKLYSSEPRGGRGSTLIRTLIIRPTVSSSPLPSSASASASTERRPLKRPQ